MPDPVVTHQDNIQWSYLTKTPSGDEMRWKTFLGDGKAASRDTTCGICELPPGAALPVHRHAHSEAYLVSEGAGEVLLDEDIVHVRPGSVLFIPGDMPHAIRNRGEQTLRLIWIFAADTWEDVEYIRVERDF